MRVGVFGDSFADPQPGQDNREPESWMYQLQQISGYTVDAYGESGVSAWYSYAKFLQHYRDYDTVVFVFTDVNRIHNVPKFTDETNFNFVKPNTLEHLEFFTDSDKDKMRNVVNTYWRDLQNDQFDLFVYQSIFDSVNKLCKQEGINLVSVFPFENFHNPDTVDLTNTVGDCWRGLCCVSSQEAEATTGRFGQFSYDARDCHLSGINNLCFAKLIQKSIDHNSKTVYSISEENAHEHGFVFDAEHVDKYFQTS